VTEPWWKSAVVYQIYPRSFADTDGDGVGDLEGIRHRLDHLAWLGVDALWLSPVYRSPMADFGYDISDFCAIDPLFGSLDDFDHLLADAHSLGIKLILDWVPNHTSDQHPWFVDSRSARDAPKRDWYVWRDQRPGGKPPNNWVASFAPEPTWTHDPATDQSYLHLFLPGQPDLNWGNPEVEAAMHDVLRFWLDRGVDGFRADVVHCIGKDPSLPDDPPELAGLPHSVLHDEPLTHDLLRRIRALLDGYPGERMMVGEVYLLDIDRMATYYGDGAGDELNLSFNFLPVHSPWDAGIWRDHLASTEQALAPRGGWPTWVLSNHDVPRHRTRYSGWPNEPADATRTEARARRSSTRVRSSACSTPTCPPTAWSTRAAATAVVRPSPGAPTSATAGALPATPSRGSPSRPRPTRETWPPSAPTPRRSCTCTGASSRCGAGRRPSGSATRSCSTRPPR
jgi:alpha-glucosidase